MQALMWVIFAGSLGLAQWITYHRAHASVALDKPVNVKGFRVSLPLDWERTENWDPKQGVLEVIDPDHSRAINITVSRFSAVDDSSDDDSDGQLSARSVETIPFAGLGTSGKLAVVPRPQRQPDDSVIMRDALVAAAGLPNGDLVKIELNTGEPRIGPADRALVQAIANSITRRPPRSAASQPAKE